jgi:fumarate reductase iron-sulfur subunit
MVAELLVSFWRGDKNGRDESVPRRKSQTVLVTFVQRNVDPTLSYRFTFRVGGCRSYAI